MAITKRKGWTINLGDIFKGLTGATATPATSATATPATPATTTPATTSPQQGWTRPKAESILEKLTGSSAQKTATPTTGISLSSLAGGPLGTSLLNIQQTIADILGNAKTLLTPTTTTPATTTPAAPITMTPTTTDTTTTPATTDTTTTPTETSLFSDVLGGQISDLVQNIVSQLTAKPYTTEQEQAILAQADKQVETRYQQARDELMRSLAARGLDPSSPQAVAALQQLALGEASEKAANRRQLGISAIQEAITRPQQALQQLYGLENLSQSRLAQMMGYAGAPTTTQQLISSYAALPSLYGIPAATSAQMASEVSAPIRQLAQLLTLLQMWQQMYPLSALQAAGGLIPSPTAQLIQQWLMQQMGGIGGTTTGTASTGGLNDLLNSLSSFMETAGSFPSYGIETVYPGVSQIPSLTDLIQSLITLPTINLGGG